MSDSVSLSLSFPPLLVPITDSVLPNCTCGTVNTLGLQHKRPPVRDQPKTTSCSCFYSNKAHTLSYLRTKWVTTVPPNAAASPSSSSSWRTRSEGILRSEGDTYRLLTSIVILLLMCETLSDT